MPYYKHKISLVPNAPTGGAKFEVQLSRFPRRNELFRGRSMFKWCFTPPQKTLLWDGANSLKRQTVSAVFKHFQGEDAYCVCVFAVQTKYLIGAEHICLFAVNATETTSKMIVV